MKFAGWPWTINYLVMWPTSQGCSVDSDTIPEEAIYIPLIALEARRDTNVRNKRCERSPFPNTLVHTQTADDGAFHMMLKCSEGTSICLPVPMKFIANKWGRIPNMPLLFSRGFLFHAAREISISLEWLCSKKPSCCYTIPPPSCLSLALLGQARSHCQNLCVCSNKIALSAEFFAHVPPSFFPLFPAATSQIILAALNLETWIGEVYKPVFCPLELLWLKGARRKYPLRALQGLSFFTEAQHALKTRTRFVPSFYIDQRHPSPSWLLGIPSFWVRKPA